MEKENNIFTQFASEWKDPERDNTEHLRDGLILTWLKTPSLWYFSPNILVNQDRAGPKACHIFTSYLGGLPFCKKKNPLGLETFLLHFGAIQENSEMETIFRSSDELEF